MREKIFSSTPKLGRVLAAGGTLTVMGCVREDLFIGHSLHRSPRSIRMIEVGKPSYGGVTKPHPPVFIMPVRARSLDGAVHEIGSMCDGVLSARLSATREVMERAGFSGEDYDRGLTHEGGMGKARLIEILRQQAHLMMEWGSEELLTFVDTLLVRWVGAKWWVPPEAVHHAAKILLTNGTPHPVNEMPKSELIHTANGCFVKRELPSGSIWGRIKIP